MIDRRLGLLPVLAIAAGCAVPALDHGAVASPEPHASEVGAEILRKGGNAVDAAVAVHLALAVTFPNAGNLGGGGFMILHVDGKDVALDFRETAPSGARRDMYLGRDGKVVPGMSLDTARAAGVPGSVAGLWAAHRRFGSLPWKDLVAPALRLAREGWTLDAWSARSFAREKRNNFPKYFRGAPGDRFRQPDLAATLERIATNGRDGFYRGETARLIVAEMKRRDGLISLEDLAGYRAIFREPVVGRYRDLRIVSMPPPSSGGVALLQMLNMLEGFDPKGPRARYMHLVAEIEKRVFADRATYLGDGDFVDVPVAGLIAKDYAAARASTIRPDARTRPAAIAPGTPGRRESEQTLHFSVVDRRGNAVACTTTLNRNHGCGIVVEGAGFLLNNEMDDFSAKPGVPNSFGVTGGEANAIAPGKRMLSSMSPTIVFRDGRPWLVVGSPGGPTIFTTVFQVIVNRRDFGMTPAEAVAAPRFHHQWPPPGPAVDPILVDGAPDGETTKRLKALGYAIVLRGALGNVQAIEIDGRRAIPVSDPRGIGRAVTASGSPATSRP